MTNHITIYRQPGRFAGWPANHGIWQWGDEILVGFAVGRYLDQGRFHAIDMRAPRGIMFGRSQDGGRTWEVEDGAAAGLAAACYNHTLGTAEPTHCPGDVDFTSSGFAAMFGRLDNRRGPSHFHLSQDRGRSWQGPYILPDMGTPGLAARTSYIVESSRSMLAFFTCAKANGKEGDAFCGRSWDGGKTWLRTAYIMRKSTSADGYCIMPSAVRTPDGLFCAVRHQWSEPAGVDEFGTPYRRHGSCIELLVSPTHDGLTWQRVCNTRYYAVHSSPGWLVELADRRICCVYAVRQEPHRICAALYDPGKLPHEFGPEHIIAEGAASRDFGYPVAVRRKDGSVLVIYYWHDSEERPERYIRATIWEPPE